MPRACIVQVVGVSGSGKTAAIVEASRMLVAMGLRVAVLKHTHHDIDTPGKDSWRYLEEGGAVVSIVVKGGGERAALFLRNTRLEDLVKAAAEVADAVLVEGFKGISMGLRIELRGAENTSATAVKIVGAVLQCRGVSRETPGITAAGRGEEGDRED